MHRKKQKYTQLLNVLQDISSLRLFLCEDIKNTEKKNPLW